MASTHKAKWVEFDTQLCASKDWVIFHDESLERTTNGQGFIREKTYDVLKMLDAGSWFNPSFQNERIPRLDETLILLQELNLQPNIELKYVDPKNSREIQSFISLLEKVWPKSKLTKNDFRRCAYPCPQIYSPVSSDRPSTMKVQ